MSSSKMGLIYASAFKANLYKTFVLLWELLLQCVVYMRLYVIDDDLWSCLHMRHTAQISDEIQNMWSLYSERDEGFPRYLCSNRLNRTMSITIMCSSWRNAVCVFKLIKCTQVSSRKVHLRKLLEIIFLSVNLQACVALNI